jgi:hypothetical protein
MTQLERLHLAQSQGLLANLNLNLGLLRTFPSWSESETSFERLLVNSSHVSSLLAAGPVKASGQSVSSASPRYPAQGISSITIGNQNIAFIDWTTWYILNPIVVTSFSVVLAKFQVRGRSSLAMLKCY